MNECPWCDDPAACRTCPPPGPPLTPAEEDELAAEILALSVAFLDDLRESDEPEEPA